MAETDVFTLHVCTGCAPKGSGAAFAASMRARFADEPALAGGRVEEFACLGNCKRGGRASLAGAGRWSWLFGGFGPDAATPLADFVRRWLASPDGAVPKAERPAALTKTILGRVPPLDHPR